MEKIPLESISKDVNDKKVVGSGQHGLMRGKSCLTNLTVFYNEVTGLVAEGREGGGVYCGFNG